MAPGRRTSLAAVDWANLRSRVEAAGRAVAEGETEYSPEHTRERLHERARELARPIGAPPPRDRLEVVTFSLANEVYAVESRYVIEVFPLRELAPLPGAKAPVFGLTAWRGDLLIILDLRPVLGLPATALNDLTRVIVLGQHRGAFGILADAVHDLVGIAASELREPPQGSKAKKGYVRGMTSQAVLLLDGDLLLRLLETDRGRRLEGSK